MPGLTYLTITSGEQAGHSVCVSEPMTIGRDPGPLGLADPSASHRHAEVRPVASGLEIRDLGSSNGTLVNGKLIAAATHLVLGDEIQVGATTLRVTPDADAMARPAVAATPSASRAGRDDDPLMLHGAAASRQPAAVFATFAVIIVTALLLVIYFANR